jgi:hypothetical protein
VESVEVKPLLHLRVGEQQDLEAAIKPVAVHEV